LHEPLPDNIASKILLYMRSSRIHGCIDINLRIDLKIMVVPLLL
jgi:hypothetical protein